MFGTSSPVRRGWVRWRAGAVYAGGGGGRSGWLVPRAVQGRSGSLVALLSGEERTVAERTLLNTGW